MEGEHHKALSHRACRDAAKATTVLPSSVTVSQPTETAGAIGGGVLVVEETPVDDAVVKVVPDLPTIEDRPDLRHRYWMGTTRKSPFQNVHDGGHSFPMATGQMTDSDGSGQPTFSGPRGQEAMLTDDEVAVIVKSVARKVVSWAGTGGKRRAIKRDMDALGYRQEPTDEPLGKYLYMHRTDSLGFSAKAGDPEPMVS